MVGIGLPADPFAIEEAGHLAAMGKEGLGLGHFARGGILAEQGQDIVPCRLGRIGDGVLRHEVVVGDPQHPARGGGGAAPDVRLLDDNGPEARAVGGDRADQAGGAAADDDEVSAAHPLGPMACVCGDAVMVPALRKLAKSPEGGAARPGIVS